MLNQVAEQSFQQGMEHLAERRHREALAFFRGALEIERRNGTRRPQARYLSFYGLALALTNGGLHEAVRACRKAARQEGYRPEVCWNLGRVLLLANKRREAHRALTWGLRMQPDHPGLRGEMERMGYRRRPVLPFLSRRNALNVLLGRLRSAA
jgi:predicted Zn-dependent protease